MSSRPFEANEQAMAARKFASIFDKYQVPLKGIDIVAPYSFIRSAVTVVHLSFYGFFVYFFVMDTIKDNTVRWSSNHYAEYNLYMAIVLTIIALVSFLWATLVRITGYKCVSKRARQRAKFLNIDVPIYVAHLWDSILAFLCTSYAGLYLSNSVLSNSPTCDTEMLTSIWRCTQTNATNSLKQELLMMLTMTPLVFALVHHVTWEVQVLNWCIAEAFLAFALYTTRDLKDCVYIGLFTFLSAAIHRETYLQSIRTANLAIRHKQLIASEWERTIGVAQAFEIRSIVSATAMELKSYMTTILGSVDMLVRTSRKLSTLAQNVVTNMGGKKKRNAQEEHEVQEATASHLEVITESSKIVSGTNALMLCSIASMSDFAALQRGIKLKPEYTFVDILETLRFVISAANNVQSKVAVHLKKFDRNMKSGIYTDFRWLKDALLCLIMNGVKHSYPGATVILNISEVQAHRIMKQPSEEVLRLSRKPKAQTSIAAAQNKILTSSLTPQAHLESFLDRNTKEVYIKEHDAEYVPSMKFIHKHDTKGKMIDAASSIPASRTKGAYQESKEGGNDDDDDIESVLSLQEQTAISMEDIPPLFIRFEVTDMGEEDVPLERFFSPASIAERITEGHGLSLYTLSKRIEALGGKYGVGERKDEVPGRVVWFSLPCEEVFTAPLVPNELSSLAAQDSVTLSIRTTTQTAATPSSPPSVSRKKRSEAEEIPRSKVGFVELPTASAEDPENPSLEVLIVDNALTSLKLISVVLCVAGHVPSTVDSGASAIERVFERQNSDDEVPFEILIIDLNMTPMSGFECIKRLRRQERHWQESSEQADGEPDMGMQLCIMAISVNTDEQTQKLAIECGADAFLPKPFRIEAFNNAWHGFVFKKTQKMFQDGQIKINGQVITDANRATVKKNSQRDKVTIDNITL